MPQSWLPGLRVAVVLMPRSSAQLGLALVYQLHRMRAQSRESPVSVRGSNRTTDEQRTSPVVKSVDEDLHCIFTGWARS
jgi:hypothetical protein